MPFAWHAVPRPKHGPQENPSPLMSYATTPSPVFQLNLLGNVLQRLIECTQTSPIKNSM